MMAADTERHLLFGLLGLQNGLVEQADLVVAFQAWSKDRTRSLAQVLVDRNALSEGDRAMLESLARRHVEKHGGDTERSLADVGPGPLQTLREELVRVGDSGLQATMAHLATGNAEHDPGATLTWSLGAAGPDGARFRVLRPHAKGGIGLVSVALDSELHREVALKEIRPEQADDPISRARFLLEAELTGRLEHPGVVPVYALGADTRGRPYYVMRFVRGDSLKEAIDRFHKADEKTSRDAGEHILDLRKLLTRFVSVCDAVAYAHSRGVIHRDIKPANILLGPYGETLLVDWGLAKVIGRDEPGHGAAEETLKPATASGSSETQAGTAIGTPAYMSPEQAEGRLDEMSPASDVYSLGATLFCLLTGKPPLEEQDVVEVLRKVRKGEIPPARQVNSRVPRPLEAICKKAMATNAPSRYPSARALADDIEHWLADEPVSAYAEPWWAEARRELKRHRSVVAALMIAVPIALASLASIVAHEAMTNNELQKNNQLLLDANAASKKALDKARRREDLAFQALDNYRRVVEEIQELRERPDLLPIRQRLLAAPQEIYRKLRTEIDASDPGERDTELTNRLTLADISLAAASSEIGSRADAMKAYAQAIEIMEALLRDSNDPQYRMLLASALNNLANLHVDAGRLKESREEMERSLALREKLAQEYKNSPSYLSEVALSHHNLGWLDSKTGRLEPGLEHYRKAVAIRERLARESPNDEWRKIALAQTESNLGWILNGLRQREEAREYLIHARDTLEALVALHPTYISLRLDLAMTYENLAAIDEGDAALASQRRSVEMRESIARDAPSVGSYQTSLAMALTQLGNTHRNAKRFAQALSAQQRSVAILEPVVRDHPEAANYIIALASTLSHLGLTQMDGGDPATAIQNHTRALELIGPILERDPQHMEARSLLAGTLNNRGLALAKLDRHEEALADYRQAIKEEKVCFQAAPELYQYRKWLSLHIYNMGKSLRALGRLDEAYATYQERMKLWKDALPEHQDPVEQYDAACSLALLVPAIGQGKHDGELTDSERSRRRQLTEEAFAELEASVDAGFDRATHFANDPDFDAIRSDPRFSALLLRVMDRCFPTDAFVRSP